MTAEHGISERKIVAIRQKADSLRHEFSQWRLLTNGNAAFEKHQSQVLAITGQLEGLHAATRERFDRACAEGTVLRDARNVESLLLGVRRIWEFFRSKFVQRHDATMRPFLQVADELAWACYHPILTAFKDAHRQPPLVFLNGGLSPYIINRDKPFSAESVPGEALSGAAYDRILQHLPVAIIGLPWHQMSHLPDLPVVAHEVGHAVENDFGLRGSVLANLATVLGEDNPHLKYWRAWSDEVFADLWGCMTLGPAYASSLVDFLAADPDEIGREIASDRSRYPATQLRIFLCIEALRVLHFDQEADALRTQWCLEYPNPVADDLQNFADDLTQVVTAILKRPLEAGSFAMPLCDVADLCITKEQWSWAQRAARQVTNDVPRDATTIVTTIAAARLTYEESPPSYDEKKFGDRFLDHAKSLLYPGTRYMEAHLTEEDKSALSITSHRDAREWFEDFSSWSGAH